MALAGRIPRLSVTLKRGLLRLGLTRGSERYRAVFAAVVALENAGDLPLPADFETDFNLLYRFDESHVDVLTVRSEPPIPSHPP